MGTSTGRYTCAGHDKGSQWPQRQRTQTLPDKGLDDTFAHYNEIVRRELLARGLAGQIFTQITDIECERNGLLTYDRISKVDVNKIRQANEVLLRAASERSFHTAPSQHPTLDRRFVI